MPGYIKGPRQVEVAAASPWKILSTKKKLIVGKYATDHITRKQTNAERILDLEEKRMQEIAHKHRVAEKAGTLTRDLHTRFYLQAMQYTEAYWKLLIERLAAGKGNQKKIADSLRNAEADFDHFRKKYLEATRKKPSPKEEKADACERKLEKAREEMKAAEKEHGKGSWHAKRAAIEHTNALISYLRAEVHRLYELREENPRHEKELKEAIEQAEAGFKEATETKKRLEDSM